MKKILITILVYLFTATTTSYAQFFRDRETNNNGTTENAYGSSGSGDNYGGFFRTEADNPENRPGDGGGIGQDAPVKEGLHVLIGFCLIFGVVKVVNENRKKPDKE